MTKLSALADASLNDTDQLYINDGGASRKCTVAQLRTALASLQNVVEDTTPALGGNLDVSTFAVVDANGNELFKFTATASAVNEFTVANNATGSGPTLSASGGDTNIDINVTPKGSGTTNFTTGGINVTGAITVSSTVDGRDVAADGSKLDTIASSATANPNALDNVSEDTTPTLGGNLDLSSYGFVDASGNEQISFTSTASAVNEITVINAATGTGPIIDATGDDTNIDLRLDAKGSGLIKTLKGFDVTGNITVSGTVDGRDLAADGSKLDNITANAIADLVEDTSPQLGGQLDVNGNAIGDGTLELITFSETASAVNQVNVKNNITGSAPVISAAGDDTNIDLMLAGKGSGQVKVTATAVASQSQATTGTNNNVLMTPLRTQQQIDANEVTFAASRILGARAGDTAYTALTTAQAKTLTGYITDVVNDTTPQLGGNLDVNGNSIVSASAGNITITPDTTGSIVLDGLSWPQADGSADQVLKTDGAGNLSWVANSGSGLANVVDDTTPQLGGQLDVNGQALGDGTLELLAFTETASAVNHINITNAATGNGPSITAVGDDVNVSLNITPKAAGDLVLDGLKWPQADGTADYVLKTDGAGQLSWTPQAAGGNVSNTGTPVDNQIAVWTAPTTIEGDTSLTFDTATDALRVGASGSFGFGAVSILSDSAGTTTLQNIDALDTTTDATIVGANMARVAGSTYSTIQHMQDIFHSTGVVSGGGITDDTDGTITVAAGTGLIRATDSAVAQILWTDWSAESGANVALTNSDMNYIYVEYNAGSPRVIATTTERTEFNTNILLGTVYRDAANGLYITGNTRALVGDHALQMIERMKATMPFARQSGGVIGESGTRNLTVSAGVWWEGLTQFSTSAFDTSGADTFSYYYQDGVGGWTEVASSTQINNTQYDNGTGTLATLSNNAYGVHWVYLSQDDEIYVLFGTGDYTLSNAEAAGAPASVPPLFDESYVRLIGKIIIQKSASAFQEVISAFDTALNTAQASDHGLLTGLGDDDHTQYLLVDGSRAYGGTFISDTDNTDDIGSGTVRWKDIYGLTVNTGTDAADTLKLRGYDVDGTSWVDILTITANNTVTADLHSSVTIGGNAILQNVLEDTTPQLGGNLDVNGNSLVSTANGNITLTPNGTGNVVLGSFTFDADQTVGVGQDNYVMTYDNGTGLISLEASAGGGLSNVVEDTTPQLGGDLDAQGNNITSLGVVFMTEQAAADADVAGDGQWWVKSDTPNTPWFTNDAGTDFQLATLAGTETLTNKTIAAANNTLSIATTDLSDASALSGTSAQIVVYNSGWTAASMSGDATIATSGAITLTATNTNLTTLANVTTVGALTAGSIGSGFGTISTGNAITTTADVTGASLIATGDTAASDSAAIGYTATEGIIITGQGSTNDVTIKNDADTAVINIPTGTTNVDVVGDLSAGTITAPVDISTETTGTLTSSSLNKTVQCTGNITLPNSGYASGDIILIDPGGTARTITRPATHTMYIADTDSATGTTSAHNIVTAMYHGSSKWTLQGAVT